MAILENFEPQNVFHYFEEICGIPFLPNIDVIVDGEFKIEEKDNSLHWKGSANQRVIDVKESLKTGKVQLYRKY